MGSREDGDFELEAGNGSVEIGQTLEPLDDSFAAPVEEEPPTFRRILFWQRYKVYIIGFGLLMLMIILLTLSVVAAQVILGMGNYLKSAGSKDPALPKPIPDDGIPINPTWPYYRLPAWFVPVSYDVFIRPDYTTWETFSGKVKIVLNATQSIRYFVLHSLDLEVLGARVINATDGQTIETVELSLITFNRTFEYMFLGLRAELKTGMYMLDIDFQGTAVQPMRGFYRSSWNDPDTGAPLWMLSTQFESTDARRAFPCFDEPALKAHFRVRVTAPAGLTVLANMPAEGTPEPYGDGKLLHTFAETPLMSTYLIAYAVGDLASVRGDFASNGGRKELRVWATRGSEAQGAFALRMAAAALEHFEAYFDEPYRLPKMDMLAVPDFAAGAMENWGLVTYRIADLLLSGDDENSLAAQMRIASVVAHELAHQWTGDLVTMTWWGQLFLNEAFATLLQYNGTQAAQPGWGSWMDTWIFDQSYGMSAMASPGAHAIEVGDALTPAQISELFDGITYEFGGSVLRMFDLSNSTAFRTGMRAYIAAHRLGLADSNALFDALSAAGSVPVDFAASWTRQPGFPLVRVSNSNASVSLAPSPVTTVTQFRFSPSGAPTSGPTWWVPLPVLHADGSVTRNLALLPDQPTRELPLSPAPWFKLNAGQLGPYVVDYPAAHWALLRENFADMPDLDRAGLLRDMFLLVNAGERPLGDALALLSAALGGGEHAGVVWGMPGDALARWTRLLADSVCGSAFDEFVRELLRPHYADVGWALAPSDDMSRRMYRVRVLVLAVQFALPEALADARAMFLAGNASQTDPDVRYALYRGAAACPAQDGGLEVWRALLAQYSLATTSALDRTRLLSALGSAPSRALLQATLALALRPDDGNSTYVRLQDLYYVVAPVAQNPFGREMAWAWLRANWDALAAAKFGSISRLVVTVCGQLASPFYHQEVASFFAAHNPDAAVYAITQALDVINANIDWLHHNEKDVCGYFDVPFVN